MEGEIRVLLVDDHAILRDGVRALLEREGDMRVVGEAENGVEAVVKARELAPDVVLMDLAMPLLNGVEATRQIKRYLPDTRVLALSMYSDDEHVFQALKAGASGYLVKETPAAELVVAIRSINSGAPSFSPAISRKIMESYLNEDDAKKSGGRQDKLTSRENEALQLIAEGYTNNEVARLMNISVKTVETHRAHIMSKLDIHEVAGLIKYAIRKGLIVVDTR